MRTKVTKKYLEDVAKEQGITLSQMQEIVEAPFKFTSEVFSKGNRETMEFDSVRLMYFGVFKVKEGRKKRFKQINNDKNSIKS
jgi:nucleoid DNA-binding protein